MSVIGHSPLAGASGAAGGDSGPLYVDDVFSTFLYTATSATTQTITNGIDLSGEGGMVWIKNRANGGSHTNHAIVDSERVGTHGHNALWPNLMEQEWNPSTAGDVVVTSLNSDGFTRGGNHNVDITDANYVSWSFRKAPGFFDVVTYTGTGSAQNISHSLGSVPGMIMIHCRDGYHDWEVYHRSTGATKSLHLNQNYAQATDSTVWNNTTPTSSVFTVGTSSNVNQNGHNYVAYVFAHDEQSFGTDSDEAIIKCASYTGTGSSVDINVGFEAQWVLIKNISNASDQYGDADWTLYDMMRPFNKTSSRKLHPNTNASDTSGGRVFPTATGFGVDNESNIDFNASGDTYVYMAIRRPHKPPTAGTEAFAMDTGSSSSTIPTFDSGFTVDMSFLIHPNSTISNMNIDRLLGNKYLMPNTNSAQSSSSSFTWDSNVGWGKDYNSNAYSYMFRRAPGFFDAVAYKGSNNSGSTSYTHNLEVVPELIIFRVRNAGGQWYVYSSVLGSSKYLTLNGSQAEATLTWTTPTATQFTAFAGINATHEDYIVYLFATLDGISKVGSYSGTGSNINVDCGFTAGARFVLIKRTDSSGDWYFWDTLRGIVSGNDPYSLMNTYDAQVTNTDYIDPLNAGFTVTSSAPAALNTSGGTYLFLAIA